MPHVDDGTLHALLDGALPAAEPARAEAVEAHLEGCADCRARLEAAAGLRERAGAILAALEPEAPAGATPPLAPDFDEVVRRSAARGGAASPGEPRRPGGSRPLRWAPVLAWAATIVVALGIGYLVRDQVVPAAGRPEAALQTTAPPAAEVTVAAGAPAADAEEEIEQQQAAAATDAGADGTLERDASAEAARTAAGEDAGGLDAGPAGAAGPAPPAPRRMPRSPADSGTAADQAAPRPLSGAVERETRAGSRPATGAATAAESGAEASQEAARSARPREEAPRHHPEPTAPAQPRRQTAGPPPAGSGQSAAHPPAVGARAERPETASAPERRPAAPPVPPAPPPAPTSEADATVLDSIATEPLVIVDPGAAPPIVVTGQAAAAPEGWRAVALDEATRLLQGPLYALPGARVLGVFVDPAADSVRVRSRQRLPDGDLLELTQRPVDGGRFAEEVVVVPRRRLGRTKRPQAEAEETPAAAAANETARRSATVVVDGFELTVEGDLPAEALRILVRNAVPLAAPPGGADAP